MKRHILLAAAASIAFAPAAFAQGAMQPKQGVQKDSTQRESGTKAERLAAADTRFLQNAAIGGMFEVQSSDLAQKKAEDAAVKDFASQMIRDHTQANQELDGIASGFGATPPKELDSKHRQVMQRLERESGKAFEQTYVRAQRDSHREAVSLFESYAANGKNPQLQQFAEKTLPTLKDHLQSVESLSGVAQREGPKNTGRSAAEPTKKSGEGMQKSQ